MKILLILALLPSAVYMSYSLCGVCSPITNLACVDVNKFAVCVQGRPQADHIKCPGETICSLNLNTCAEKSDEDPPACDSCGKCNDVFACRTYNKFSLCYGSSEPNSINYTCPDNLVCNLESPTICSDPTGLGSTCPISTLVTTSAPIPVTEPTVPTTVSPITSPTEFCKSKQVSGRHDATSDKKCSQYINCYDINGQWYGNTYLCPSNTYFNETSKMCGKGVPKRCSSILEVCD